MMPCMDGIETLRRIREVGCDAKVIVISAAMTARSIKALYGLGVSAFLTKPISRARLLKEMENALNETAEVSE